MKCIGLVNMLALYVLDIGLVVYADLECRVDHLKGCGDVLVKHDLPSNLSGMLAGRADQSVLISLTYLAPSTWNEIQSIILKSDSCYQDLTFDDEYCENTTSWIPLTGDVWTTNNLVNSR